MTTFQKVIKYLAFAFAIFLSVSIISGILRVFVAIPGFFGHSPVEEQKEYTLGTNLTAIKTELSASSLEIKTGDSFKVESNHKYIDCKEEGNCLVIKEKKSVFPGHWDHVRVTVTVPKGTVFQTADIGAGAGEVDIEELIADSLKIELGAGELNYSGTLTGFSRIDYGIGEAQLSLTGSEKDYQISLDKGVGEATINGMKMGDNSLYGTGTNQIEIDGGVGEIDISFQSVF